MSIKSQKIKQELQRCAKDPAYFISNYVKTSHASRGLIDLKLFDFQKDLVHDLQHNRFNIILKARQLGISTVTSGYILWLMLFRRNKNILVVATKVGTAANIVKKVQQMYENLPEWIVISKPITNNKTEFELENRSRIKAESTEKSSGRSEAVSLLVIDEAAHVANLDGDDGLWTGIYPTLSTGGGCIAISTPNGVGNWYHEKCVGAQNGDNEFHLTTLMWDVHPERDQAWFDKETRNMNPRQVAQELLCSFLASGETVIDPDDLMEIERFLSTKNPSTGMVYSEPDYRTHIDRNLWIWEDYNPSHTYLISADVARGDGKDYSTVHVLDINTMMQVAEYRGKITYDNFAILLDKIGADYGKPLMVVENNNLGIAVLNKLQELGYPNLYYSKKGSGDYVEATVAESTESTSIVPGITNSSTSRPQIVAKMEEFVREKRFMIRSNRLLDEMRTFIWTASGKPQAQKNKNDDLIMAFAFACWVKETAIDVDERDQELTKAMLSGMKKSNRTIETGIYSSRKDSVGPGILRGKNKNLRQQAEMYHKYAGLWKG